MRISDWSSDVCSSDPVAEPDEMTLLPDAREIAATAWRTLQLPEIAALRGRLIPEWPVYDMLEDRPAPAALAGRIDAIAYDGDRADIVVDWKGDIAPSDKDMPVHAGQLADYLRVTSRTEERRVGKEGVMTCSLRRSPNNSKK